MVSLFLLISMVGTVSAAFNYSDVKEVSDNQLSRGGALTSLGEGEGAGFYMAIYEDTVRTPNKRVEDAIKKRFGVDFKVDLSPAQSSGKLLFSDFFKDPITSKYKGISTPSLRSSLATDCVRIIAAQAEDEKRRWDLVRKRLGERLEGIEEGTLEVNENDLINRELLNRLIGQVDADSERRLNELISAIPDATSLNEQDTLLRCYSDFSREVDFELRLQSILTPTRRQMEVLGTFMNDRLDDFTDQNSLYGSAFPRYDLLFDIDVIDYIIFGSPVSVTTGVSGTPSGLRLPNARFSSYGDIIEQTVDPRDLPPSQGGTGSSDLGPNGAPNGETSVTGPVSKGGGFGTSSGDFAGPLCVDDPGGLDLQFPDEQADEQNPTSGPTGTRAEGDTEDVDVLPPLPDVSELPEDEPGARAGQSSTGEGTFQVGPNLSVSCEGTAGVDFGNDFLKLLFCINIGFEKTGASWNAVRDEDCIACHVYRMNEVFEEYVFKASVRPHKNTGQIMESAVCEDGYGDDIGFHFFLEWVPVKLFPDICYPEGGDGNDTEARAEYASMVGYPEVLHRTDRETMYVECEADFKDESSQKRCQEALLGKTSLEYSEFKAAYSADLKRAYQEDVNQRLQDIDQVDKKSNVWANLVGDHGIAERELHVFLYRLGQDRPRFGEEELIEQDFKDRQETLQRKITALKNRSDLSEVQKLEQYLCLKGFALAANNDRSVGFNCQEEDTLVALEDDIVTERNRVMRIVSRWNQQSRDFNKENKCATFQGSGLIDAFWDNTFAQKTDAGYFFETDYRKTQTPREQITGQLSANADLTDFDSLFTAINEEVEFIATTQDRQQQQERFQTDQEQGLQLYSAMAAELSSFRSNMQALTDWWAEMVDDKQFVNKAGERINVLQSYIEKLQ